MTKQLPSWMLDSCSESEGVADVEEPPRNVEPAEELLSLPSFPVAPVLPECWAARVRASFAQTMEKIGKQKHMFRIATGCSGTGAITYSLEDHSCALADCMPTQTCNLSLLSGSMSRARCL